MRSRKMGSDPIFDAELEAALEGERRRQEEYVELIASENYVSRRVLEAQGSVLTNKYADGLPGRRTYRGCEHVDAVETLAIERAKRLFGAAYANVQPYSGSQANEAAYLALLEPGDVVLGMDPAQGGHRTHGDRSNFSGKLFRAVHYGVDPVTGLIDYEGAAELALRRRPKLVVAGFSAYSRSVDWRRFRTIADSVGARLLVDMAHVAGLVAAGLCPNPVPIADVTTTTTHKTLRGPRGGLILAGEDGDIARRLDAAVFPGVQGGPLMHVIAGKAAAFLEASAPEFVDYQRRVVANARRLAAGLEARGYSIAAGGTDNHMLLVALPAGGLGAAEAEIALERAHIAVNGVAMPGLGGAGRGLRLGTPAVTTRGFGPDEIDAVAAGIADVLAAPDSDAGVGRVRERMRALCARFPVYVRDDRSR
ncbi:MAG TPA: serine hydroxymethyltransferase [Gammaproteobacteria bacterium]|nr:serine hydroxymethyltransferase [Gammaproteobacteria bacterium]